MNDQISPKSQTRPDSSIWKVIAASSAGTMIEWYDFYIFGSLGTIIAPLFYPPGDPAVQFLVLLATFATGFLVRPFGALFFGRIGDLVGRKYAFLLTLIIMGGATTAIGFLPTYEQIGLFAPAILVTLRLLQGLALGGEYGGAATYVAEHSPDHKRGYFTSFIQTTATLGLFLSLAVILITRLTMGDEAFRRLGVAHTFCCFNFSRCHVVLHPLEIERIAAFCSHEGERQNFTKTDFRNFSKRRKSQINAACFIWRRCRTGRGLVHRPILCVVFLANGLESELRYRKHHCGGRSGPRHAVFYILRNAIRSNWQKKNHDVGLFDRRTNLLPHL